MAENIYIYIEYTHTTTVQIDFNKTAIILTCKLQTDRITTLQTEIPTRNKQEQGQIKLKTGRSETRRSSPESSDTTVSLRFLGRNGFLILSLVYPINYKLILSWFGRKKTPEFRRKSLVGNRLAFCSVSPGFF